MVSLRGIRKPTQRSLVSADRPSVSPAGTWFRTREGRHYACEIVLIIVVKLALLVVLWFVVIKPWPRPATSPTSFVQQLYLPASPAVATKRHD
jgi:hypothetical protein